MKLYQTQQLMNYVKIIQKELLSSLSLYFFFFVRFIGTRQNMRSVFDPVCSYVFTTIFFDRISTCLLKLVLM
jgi:hypothetical protein